MDLSRCLTNHNWDQENESTVLSPTLDDHWEHYLLFPDHKDKNYALEADLTLLHGEELNKQIYKEAGVIIRCMGESRYYYAGFGGFGARAFISVVEQKDGTANWSCLEKLGKKEEVEFNKSYWFRVECQGAKISLSDDRGNRISVESDTYPSGYFGLRALRTQARFANIKKSGPSVLKAFVIMPFTKPLSFVYEIIQDVVGKEGLECHRVDEFAICKPVIDDVKDWLINADLVIADLTDQNPNVYYETGFAHALNKKLIFLAQSESDLAFNVRHIRTLFYTNPTELRTGLRQAINETLAAERGE
jgi:hypothetical protein